MPCTIHWQQNREQKEYSPQLIINNILILLFRSLEIYNGYMSWDEYFKVHKVQGATG